MVAGVFSSIMYMTSEPPFFCLLNGQKEHLPCGDLATTGPLARQKAGALLSINPWQNNLFLFLHAGLAPLNALDGKPYTSILYGNGPGYVGTGERPNVTDAESSECGGVACLKVGQRGLRSEILSLNTLSLQKARHTSSRLLCR